MFGEAGGPNASFFPAGAPDTALTTSRRSEKRPPESVISVSRWSFDSANGAASLAATPDFTDFTVNTHVFWSRPWNAMRSPRCNV